MDDDEDHGYVRPRMRHHWCDICHGHTGPGSPCAEDPPEEQQDEEDEDGTAS